MKESLSESLFFALLLSFLVVTLAQRKGFFTFPKREEKAFFFPGKYLLFAFSTYFFTILLASLLTRVFPQAEKGVLQIFVLCMVATFLILLLLLLDRKIVNILFTGTPFPSSIFQDFGKNLKLGMITWFISYPIVLFIGLFVQLITYTFWKEKEMHQVAVEQLKKTHGWVFVGLSVIIVFIVPFIEEMLFRGFLQTYLKKKLGIVGGVAISSLVFAGAHYAVKQGLGNIELLISLFSLSCFLGYLYERQKNFWAPYGLHMTFNAITILVLILQASK